MSSNRLPGKHARDLDKILRALGYRLLRTDGGHLVYGHDRQANYTCPATPSDHRAWANDIAELKRRHPGYFEVKKSERPKAPARSRKTQHATQRARVVALVNRATRRPDRPLVKEIPRLDYTGCPDCGYRWQSDLDPAGRSCPRCPGQIQECVA